MIKFSFQNQTTQVQILASPLTSSVTINSLLRLPMLQFPQLENGGNNSFHLRKLLRGLYESIHETSLGKCLALRKPLTNVHYYYLKTSIFPCNFSDQNEV